MKAYAYRSAAQLYYNLKIGISKKYTKKSIRGPETKKTIFSHGTPTYFQTGNERTLKLEDQEYAGIITF